MNRDHDPVLDEQTLNDARSAAQILRDMMDRDDVTVFTRDQAKALIEVAESWNKIKGAIAVASWLGVGLKWFVAFVIAWIAFKSQLYEFIKGIANGH